MPPDSSSFTALNISASAVPECMSSFSIPAGPDTDLWRKPPSSDTSTCPILYTALRHPFRSAEVTVSADWEIEWDQAGLVIFAGAPPGIIGGARPSSPHQQQQQHGSDNTSSSNTVVAIPPPEDSTAPPPAYSSLPTSSCKWVKLGLEFNSNACHATSVCATDSGADWSLTALQNRGPRSDLRIKMDRVGPALWLWIEDEHGGWRKIREVTWFFWGVEDKAVRVGVYASRPANLAPTVWERRHGGPRITQRNLVVEFEGLEIW
ncbi:hypothetical protein K490DRAFT_69138 [Saccharata proteae CBS 121410]|uniref:Uncharacterized protein n=1 Tax=Saccharata proteae CBS 121410 TaxID=1314787 RepID=A0A9P4HQG9_9PEZI|nr:hypothetical protein K490DRAFT_69138 [Saccharata proteae CBS 121410]